MWVLLSLLVVVTLELLRRNRALQVVLRQQLPMLSPKPVSPTALRQLGRLQWLRQQQAERVASQQSPTEPGWLSFFARHSLRAVSPQALALFHGEQLMQCEGVRWTVALEGRVRGFLQRSLAGSAACVSLSTDALLDDLTPFGISRWLLFTSELEGDSKERVQLWAGYSARSEFPGAEQLLKLQEEFERRIAQQQAAEALSRQATESSQRAAHQERVLAQVSHDIRSPLLSVSAALHALQASAAGVEEHKLLRSSLRSCEQVSELLDDLLDVVRESSSALRARTIPVPVKAFVHDLCQSMLPLVQAKGLELNLEQLASSTERRTERGTEKGAEKALHAQADPRHLRRMLSNLLSNAIKYTRKGQVCVRVFQQDTRVAIEVSDSGIGMSPEQIRLLCEPFQRFAPDEASGIGLGMAVTRALAKANQGELEVCSELAKGSTFRLLLPVSCAQELVQTPAPDAKPSVVQQPRVQQKLSIWLLDDDAAVVASLQRLLERQGHNVTGLHSLDALKAQLKHGRPDVLIGDAELGNKRLHDCAEVLKNAAFQGRWLVLSGDAGQEGAARALGASKFFLKPVAIAELEAELQRTEGESL